MQRLVDILAGRDVGDRSLYVGDETHNFLADLPQTIWSAAAEREPQLSLTPPVLHACKKLLNGFEDFQLSFTALHLKEKQVIRESIKFQLQDLDRWLRQDDQILSMSVSQTYSL